MIPFWQSHTPAQIALTAALDAVWVIGFVIGWCIALWQHFAAPTVPTGPIAKEIKAICDKLTIDKVAMSQPGPKTRKRSAKAVVIG